MCEFVSPFLLIRAACWILDQATLHQSVFWCDLAKPQLRPWYRELDKLRGVASVSKEGSSAQQYTLTSSGPGPISRPPYPIALFWPTPIWPFRGISQPCLLHKSHKCYVIDCSQLGERQVDMARRVEL
jgi:hypothetical protein